MTILAKNELPAWAKRWACERCGLPREVDGLLLLGGQVTCALCYSTAGVDPEDVDRRVVAPSASGKVLNPHQVSGVRWLARRRTALIQDEMGLGKSATAIRATPPSHGLIVICPASVVGNWYAEVAAWDQGPRLKVDRLCDTGVLSCGPGFVAVRGYEQLLRVQRFTVTQPCVLVLDEAQKVKNPGIATTSRVRELRDVVLAAGGRVWVCTATPAMNNLEELWSVLQNAYLGYAAFPGGWLQLDQLAAEWRDSGKAPTGRSLELIREGLARVRIRRLKRVQLRDLPDKRYEVVNVELSAGDAKVIHEHAKRLVAFSMARQAAKDGRIPNPEERGLEAEERERRMELLRQHADGVYLTLREPTPTQIRESVALAMAWGSRSPERGLLHKVRAALAMAKVSALKDLVDHYEALGEPLIVFCAHLKPVQFLEARPGWSIICGSVPKGQRTKRVAEFQAGRLQGLAITIDAGGVGLTLTRSAVAVFVDREWNPAANNQAADRIHRIGQTRGVRIVYMVADHAVDQRVEEVNEQKSNLINALDDLEVPA